MNVPVSTLSCATCGTDLRDYWSSYPGKEGEVCEDCYDEETYTCGFCEERERNDYRGFVTAFSRLITAEDERLRSGVYEIVRWPYYIDEMLWSHVIVDAVRRIGDGPAWLEQGHDRDLSPAYHLCASCGGEALFCRRTRSGLWTAGGKRYRTKRLARRRARELLQARAARWRSE